MEAQEESDQNSLILKKSEVEQLLMSLVSIAKCSCLFELVLSIALTCIIMATYVLNGIDSLSIISVMCSYFLMTLSSLLNNLLAVLFVFWACKFKIDAKTQNGVRLFYCRLFGLII